jgi:hypothetical protein
VSISLEKIRKSIISHKEGGWPDNAIGDYIRRNISSFSQGDFVPNYTGNFKSEISYTFMNNENVNVKLNRENRKKIAGIANKLGLRIEFERNTNVLGIFSKKRKWSFKRTILKVCGDPQSIIVKDPNYENTGKLLEEVGSVFGAEA